jgi:hypothetical protein
MFKTDELLALEADDLGELLLSADGDGIEQRAAALGLDVTEPRQRQAVERAMHYYDGQLDPNPFSQAAALEDAEWTAPEPEGPVIGGAQDHIRENLMPDETAGQGPTGGGDADLEALTDVLTAELSEPQPALGGMDELASALAESAASGRPFIAGTFAAYATPEGGVCLVTENPAGDIRRDMFPPRMVRLVLGMMNGKAPKGLGMLSRLMTRRGQ